MSILLDANAFADGEPMPEHPENCCSGTGSCAETPSTVASSPMEEREETRAGTRPLHHASQIGNREIISRLVQKSASINAVNELKQSALHLATTHSQLEVSSSSLTRRNSIFLMWSGRAKNLKLVRYLNAVKFCEKTRSPLATASFRMR